MRRQTVLRGWGLTGPQKCVPAGGRGGEQAELRMDRGETRTEEVFTRCWRADPGEEGRGHGGGGGRRGDSESPVGYDAPDVSTALTHARLRVQ